MNSRLLALCRYGFYLSVLLVLYGTFFPFHFDFSSFSWSRFSLIPFWDAERGRIHSLPDMLSNILLTVPLGFFGAMWFGRTRKLKVVAQWFFVGLCLGLLSEIIQLAIPSRLSDITDALNNGIGAFAGAAFACLFGAQIMDFLSGSLMDRRHTYFLILVGIATAGALLPFDFGLDVSHIGSTVKQLWSNPWELGTPVQDEWIQMAVFAMIGGLAGLLGLNVRSAQACLRLEGGSKLPHSKAPSAQNYGRMQPNRIVATAFALPFILEPMQFLVESHAPSGRDVVMNFVGVAAGFAAARIKPALVRPATGFVLMNLAIIAQGLSPYRFGGRSPFKWIPLVEYYNQTTGAALYDALMGILMYGLLAALWPRRTTILWAIALAGLIEAAQMFIATRSPGITDVLIAGIGAWVGFTVFKSATDYTDFTDLPK
jgi:glycopeptide antibiotics resistance protein